MEAKKKINEFEEKKLLELIDNYWYDFSIRVSDSEYDIFATNREFEKKYIHLKQTSSNTNSIEEVNFSISGQQICDYLLEFEYTDYMSIINNLSDNLKVLISDLFYTRGIIYDRKASNLINLDMATKNGDDTTNFTTYQGEKTGWHGHPIAFYKIGEYSWLGQGFQETKTFYQVAAELGNVDALCNLAILYRDGKGVEQDFSKAFTLFKMAAEKNNVMAMYNLGILYRDGNGCKKDKKESYTWLSKAAESKNVEVCYNLGMLYYSDNNIKKAIEYLSKLVLRDSDATGEFAKDMDGLFLYQSCRVLAECYLNLYMQEISSNYINNNAEQLRRENNENFKKAVQCVDYMSGYYRLLAFLSSVYSETDIQKTFNLLYSIVHSENIDIDKLTYKDFCENYLNKNEHLLNLTKNGKQSIRLSFKHFKADQQDEEETILNYADYTSSLNQFIESILNKVFKQDNCINDFKLFNTDFEYYEDYTDELKNIINNSTDKDLLIKIAHKLQPKIPEDKLTIERSRQAILQSIATHKDNIFYVLKDIKEPIESMDTKDSRKIYNVFISAMISKLPTSENKEESCSIGAFTYGAFKNLDGGYGIAISDISEELIEITKFLNPDLNLKEVKIKLHSLFTYLNLYRIAVRNPASHATEHTNSSTEQPEFVSKLGYQEALNIAILQNDSIFNLLTDLYGNYLNNIKNKNQVQEESLSV